MNEEFKVESGIPMPKGSTKTASRIEQLKKLNINDSVLFRDVNPQDVRQLYFNPAARLGIHIVVRKVLEGSRMWRDK